MQKNNTFGSNMIDVMGGCSRQEIKVHQHGLVALVDVMPRLSPDGTADFAIVQAARVSFGQGTKTAQQDTDLIRYMMRNRHSSPFEQVECKFHCIMPVFVARQWIRHRTANVNEFSARYSVMPDRFYRPTLDTIRQQSTSNRQGGDAAVEAGTAADFLQYLADAESNYKTYQVMLNNGIARELARIALPLSIYTEWYWKIDLHNLFHFLALRLDKHAQQEIRDYAQAILTLIRPIVPIAVSAFEDYRLNAMTLSALEQEAIRTGQPLATRNTREILEYHVKRQLLGLEKE